MKLLLMTCADSCAIDRHSNRVSIFNILEYVITPTLPTVLYSLSVFTLWEREGNDAADMNALLKIKMNDRELLQSELIIRFQDPSTRVRNVTVVQGVVLSEPGQLRFEVSRGDTVLGKWDILVTVVPHAGESSGQAAIYTAP
jgi:hypothetical protein